MKLVSAQRFFGPRTFFACVLAIFIVHIMALDMYAPALPSMQQAFGVSEQHLNGTVLSFLLVSTIATVLAGPISDHWGRKPPFVAGCALFAAGSLGCAVAPSVEILVMARAVESIGYGTSATLSAAFMKDSYEGDDLKLALTLLESLIIVGPVLAPFLGSFIVEAIGWRGVFWALFASGIAALGLALLIDETQDASRRARQGLRESLKAMLDGARGLAKDRAFASYALFIGVTGMPFFAFIAVSPYILLDGFGTTYLEYSFVYAGACFANLLAPFVYMRLSKTWSTPSIMKLVVSLTGISFALLALIGPLGPLLTLAAFVPYAVAEGVARPAAYLVMLDQPPNLVGTASAFGNFSYGMITALATVAATFPWPSFIFGLVVITGFSTVASLLLYRYGM